jgi:hypothetical protein
LSAHAYLARLQNAGYHRPGEGHGLLGMRRFESGGAQGRDRTTDTVIFSHVLYQLSYLGIRVPKGVTPASERAP